MISRLKRRVSSTEAVWGIERKAGSTGRCNSGVGVVMAACEEQGSEKIPSKDFEKSSGEESLISPMLFFGGCDINLKCFLSSNRKIMRTKNY
jgi:hypothetical protein